jgi:hypothetical protein
VNTYTHTFAGDLSEAAQCLDQLVISTHWVDNKAAQTNPLQSL